jgi:hypothetical protein
MANQKGGKGSHESGNSKFRLIVLEADLASGELSHFAHAITNALRPATAHQPQRLPAPPNLASLGQDASAPEGVQIDDLDGGEIPHPNTTNGSVTASSTRKERKRNYRDPNILDNLDLEGTTGTTWVQFARAKNPRSRQKKFLAAMAWFKNHGGKAAIGIDEVYTAFRTPGVDWPYAFGDYDKVFRGLLAQDLAARTGPGLYAINVVGEGKVDNMNDE